MAQLIDDLLNLSQVTRYEIKYQEINLSLIVQNIAVEFQKMQPHRKVEFVIAPDLFSKGDFRLIRVALENLIGNVWKFTEKQPYARIEFGVIEQVSTPR
ncbi:HAMP domain-containing histidine kinase [Desulfolucanica intricata]|uniref:HAMP domain-containing histidine kinase n=1 Tax=Desulfolucanica intricata TaxID=1285191 RepID=UPI00082B347E|nr:HAMP domain-containing histidine kinase [Desulfolucanica intricata]